MPEPRSRRKPRTSDDLGALRDRLRDEVAKVVVGQSEAVDRLLAAALVGGHVLLEGVPGVAKTLLARAFTRAFDLDFRRAQFTPDMLPSDLTGTSVLRGEELRFRTGPIFTNVLLADEINRTPPKTQAALLEAMQERQVSVDGTTHALPDPFFVIATQNPVEYEGTYPLPEAQLDRFHVRVQIGYPEPEAEMAMLRLAHLGVEVASLDDVEVVADGAVLRRARQAVEATEASDEILEYVTAIVQATRRLPSATLGASPRAAVHLLAAAKASAALAGRDYVTPDDVAAMSVPVLAHRLQLRPEAEFDRYTTVDAVEAALADVAVPR
ncbi:MAG TPA: MoxR family ATPase [Acidimicrobiales bacterium]|nr:MoxR family ATPase [Acidimicrobiales bacterium]